MRSPGPITAETKFELCLYVAILFALLCFPPQRRRGDWSRNDQIPILANERDQLDRTYFGYLPTFQFVSPIFGGYRFSGEETNYQRLEGCRYKMTLYGWGIDWLWMSVLIFLLNGYALTAYFYKQWTGEAQVLPVYERNCRAITRPTMPMTNASGPP